ncbi:MAG: lipid-A-disaccharide synthase [Bacteriovoracaceae bacterium]|nr:lipid-A-disaccharide synthase [Bacteriovoracaceae bacterium]
MKSKQSCLILAGERSGEDHALTFFDDLKKSLPECEFFGVGGERLRERGVETLYDIKDFSGIGISEVLSKIPFYFKAMDQIVAEVDKRNTKTAILIDFQGFNLKLAKKLHKKGVKVLYYVAPQAWAWKAYRAKALQKCVHTLFTILPFEKEWFTKRGVSKTKSVIHPLMIEHGERLKNVRVKKAQDFEARKKRILLLPGSRRSEVSVLLPIFEKAMKLLGENEEFELATVKVESVPEECYKSDLEFSKVYDAEDLSLAFEWADMCVAASGTVTLACGLYGVPTVVCYKLSLVSEFIFGLLVKYDGPVSLTNITHQKYLFPELIQHNADRYNIVKHLKHWLNNPQAYDQCSLELSKTKELLSGDDFSVPEYMAQVIQSSYES